MADRQDGYFCLAMAIALFAGQALMAFDLFAAYASRHLSWHMEAFIAICASSAIVISVAAKYNGALGAERPKILIVTSTLGYLGFLAQPGATWISLCFAVAGPLTGLLTVLCFLLTPPRREPFRGSN